MFTLRVALEVNMAVGQNHGFANIRPGALPQATVLNGLRPNECVQKQLHQELAQHRLPKT